MIIILPLKYLWLTTKDVLGVANIRVVGKKPSHPQINRIQRGGGNWGTLRIPDGKIGEP